jgi:hypothetical protein
MPEVKAKPALLALFAVCAGFAPVPAAHGYAAAAVQAPPSSPAGSGSSSSDVTSEASRIRVIAAANRASLVIDLDGQPLDVKTERIDASNLVVEVGPVIRPARARELKAGAGVPLLFGVSVRRASADPKRVRVRLNFQAGSQAAVRTAGKRVYVDLAAGVERAASVSGPSASSAARGAVVSAAPDRAASASGRSSVPTPASPPASPPPDRAASAASASPAAPERAASASTARGAASPDRAASASRGAPGVAERSRAAPTAPAPALPDLTSAGYEDLAAKVSDVASALAKRPDINGLIALRARVVRRDDALGHGAPEIVSKVLAEIDQRLDEARRLRLKLDAQEFERAGRGRGRP